MKYDFIDDFLLNKKGVTKDITQLRDYLRTILKG